MEADASISPPPPLQKQKAETLFALASGPLALAAAKLSVHSAAITSGRDFHFYHNFDEFKSPAREIAGKSESLLRRIGSSSGLVFGRKQQPAAAAVASLPDDLDEAYDWLVNLNDEVFERFAVSMDEFRALREKEEKKNGAGASRDLDGDEGVVEEGGASSAVKVATRDTKAMAPRSRVPFHIPTIPRPQDEFNILVNNSNQPFGHVWLEMSEDGSRFVHPLEKLSALDFVDRNIGEDEPVKPLPIEDTPFKLVEGVKELKELASKLRDVDEFAVDLEHNQYRSFQGITCLMQISTRTEDFIVDTLKLHIHVGPHLREAFKDPSKRKVMHGADRDILWLQRDFGIYVCNLFDTGQASRVMQLERNSLEFLLLHFCGVTANKEYQNADWRLRPLPDEMLKYAREDTHYLLFIYDVMRRRLLSQSLESGNGDSLVEVYKRSCDICMQLYEKDLLTDTSYLYIYGLHDADFNSQQLAVVAGLFKWRDNVARAADESTGYILPNKALLEIARRLPLSSGNLRRLVRSKHPFVERYVSSVIGVIRSSVEDAAAFEGVPEQLKKGHGGAAPEQYIGAVADHSELLTTIEDPASGTVVLQMEIVDGSSSVQKTEQIAASMGSKDDNLKPPTVEHDGDRDSSVGRCMSVSSSDIGPSVQLSARAKIIDEGKMGNGSDLPSQSSKSVTVVSVQMLKKPTGAFGALLGSSSTKRKFNLDPKGRSVERDKVEIKLEEIKSSVTLPFHSFSGGVEDLKHRQGETIIPCNSQLSKSPEHQENKAAETARLEEIIPLGDESGNLHPSTEGPSDNGSKHRNWFPQLPENGGAEEFAVDTDMTVEPSSITSTSSSFQGECFQSINRSRSSKENCHRASSQEHGRYYQVQPFDYAAARKHVKFGDGRRGEASAEGDDDDDARRTTTTAPKGRHKGSVPGQVSEEGRRKGSVSGQVSDRAGDFQQPRRRQAFPASGNRSATFR